MPPDPQTDLIRRAVARGEFPKAQALWEEHALRLRAELEAGAFSAERLAETRELAEWCCNVALCARTQDLARLGQISVARQYDSPGVQPAHGFLARG